MHLGLFIYSSYRSKASSFSFFKKFFLGAIYWRSSHPRSIMQFCATYDDQEAQEQSTRLNFLHCLSQLYLLGPIKKSKESNIVLCQIMWAPLQPKYVLIIRSDPYQISTWQMNHWISTWQKNICFWFNSSECQIKYAFGLFESDNFSQDQRRPRQWLSKYSRKNV